MKKFINLVALAALLFVPWTVKAQASLPQTMDFESGLGNWTTASLHSSSGISNSDAHQGTQSFAFYYTTNPPQYLFSPELEVLSDQLLVEFWYKAYMSYYPESFQVGYSTTTSDVSSFTWGTEITTSNTEWQQYSGFVPAGTKYVSIKCTSYDQFYLFIDDIFIGEQPTCFAVNGLTASNPTSDGITLSWVDTINTGATYTVSYWKNNGDTTDISGIINTTTTLTGLDAATGYNWSVVSNCSATDASIPSLTSTFRTDCANGSCEISVASTGEYNSSYYCPTLDVYQNGSLLASITSATQQVSVCSGDTVIVLYTEPSYSWYTPSATILDGGGTTLFSGSTSSYSTGDTLIVIATPCPSCIPPTALSVNNADQNSITLSWTPRSGASLFAVYVNNTLENGNVTDTFYTFTGLNANTAYALGVQAICAADDTSSIATLVARTECGAMSIPFSDDFDSYANGFWPPCWHRLRNYGTDPSVNAQYHHSGTQSMFLLSQNDTTLFCTPGTIPLAGNEIQVSYWAYADYSPYYSPNWWIKGGVMTDTSDMSTFIALDSIGYHNCDYEFEEHEFNTSTLDPTATYWVAWMFYSDNSNIHGAIDDVSITQLSDCVRPAAASVGTVGARQVQLTWNTVNGANNYTVYYGTVNDPTSSSLQSAIAADTAFTLTGLNPETQYYAWVATNCSSSESNLRYAGTFTTLVSCPPVTGLTIDTITSDGATIRWSAGDQETQWVVILDSNDAEIVNDTTYTVSGLDPMTGHTLYVRALCDVDDTAAVRSINFATSCADATCNLTAHVTDSYNDSWNGCAINIVQAGVNIATIECPSGQSGSDYTYEVCSSAPVTLTFTRGSYPGELGGYITDGGGTVVFTITSMGSYNTGDVLATVNTPCPECVPPTNLYVDEITADGATLHWTAQDGQTTWIVRFDSTDVNVTDTFYTFTGLDARTAYTAQVATDCSGDTSTFLNTSFTTDCATGSCDITVEMADTWGDGWNGNAQLNFFQNGASVGYAKLASGGTGTATINVCSGIPVSFSWQAGSYDSECSYVIYDGGDAEIYNSATSGVNHSDTIANACPSCLIPTGVHASFIDSTLITFEWNELDSVSAYLISFNGDPYTQGFGGSETYGALTPNTEYTFSVKAVCVPGDTSNARTITVRTACSPMIIPFTEGFENSTAGDAPDCWNVISGTPDVANSVANAHSGNNSLSMGGGVDMIASRAVPLDGDSIHVSFWAKHTGGILEAGVMTNPAYDTTFTALLTTTSTSGYELFEFNTATMDHSSTYYVAFRYNGPFYYVNIDDINIRQDDGCMHPTSLTVAPSINGATLNWTNTGSTSTFAIEYRATGSTDWSIPDIVTTTTATVSGLNASTSYEVRVGTICGGDTLWTNTTFQTFCGPEPLPYAENFEAYADDVMPPCWEWNTSFCTHYDGGVFFRSYHGGGSEYVVLPPLDGNIAKLKIEFDTKVGTIAENDGILIGVADDAGLLITWLDTIQDPNFSRNNHVRKTIYFTNYNMPAGAARVTFAQYRNWDEWALIDNINIEELPDCYPVDNLTGHNLIDPEATTFTWHPMGFESEWQVYVDTVTVDIDSLDNMPASNFITVYDTTYTIPIGMIQGGGIYNFFVRANCTDDNSNWVKKEFGAGTVIMNNSTVADTVVGCGFVVYDNGGPIAGYLAPSNSALVIRSANVGSQLEIFGGKFGFGSTQATLNVYDGEGTTGTILYTYNTIDGRDTLLNTILATSITGSLTITFSVTGNMAHTGYELYVRCTGDALCPRPTELQATMISETQAEATWAGTAPNYNFYYRLHESATWVRQTVSTNSITLTGLAADTIYDMYVVALCTATDSSSASVVRQLRTHYEAPRPDCEPVSDLQVTTVTHNMAVLHWTAVPGQNRWEINYGDNLYVESSTTTYTLRNLQPSTTYTVKVRALCNEELASDWCDEVSFTTDPNPDGIDDIAGANIALFPNPASSTVTLTGIEGQAIVTVVDMNGRVSGEWRVENGKLTIDVTEMVQGAYFVRIVGEQINTIRKLIVK